MVTIDQIIADKLNGWYVGEWPIGNLISCAIALILCVVLCGLVGIERERRGSAAGLRTHLLVGVGSCIVMIISIYGFPMIPGFSRDVARLAAQVVTGVGFLGAGAIIHRNSGTKGLTTAATIWIVMAIGLACGSFNFILAIMATVIIMIVLVSFRKIEAKAVKKSPVIIMRIAPNTPFMSKVLEAVEKHECKAKDFNIELLDSREVEVTFQIFAYNSEAMIPQVVAALEKIEGVRFAGMLNAKA